MSEQGYSINVPFTINWRLAAPRDFRTLEYFLTPDISFVFHDITNGREKFIIGSYLMQSAEAEAQFEREVLPQRSQERIRNAFQHEDMSLFFSFADAQALEALFLTQGFICRRVEIHYMGRPINPAELEPDDVNKVVQECARMKVTQNLDFEAHGDVYQRVVEGVNEAVERRWKRELADKEWERKGITKKKLAIKGSIGAACLVASTVMLGLSKRLFSKRSTMGFIGGVLCAAASVVTGILGRRLAEETVEHVRKGMIVSYV